ncbi:MMPL family transporter [Paenibacillus humicus]|nr:MMPL family transporter [Paenibacillus humicus]
MRLMNRWMEAVAGRRSKWMTLAAWIVMAALLSLLLPGVRSEVDENAPNFGKHVASVQAEEVLSREFASNDGTPALVVWHREGGLRDGDLELIRQASADVAARPVAHQQAAVPLDKLPAPALRAQLSQDGSTLVWAVTFKPEAGTPELKEGTLELRERINALAGGQDVFAAASAAADSSVPSARLTGPAGIAVDATALFSSADVSLLIATVLLVLVFLLVIYRSPVLALIPLLAVGFAYGVTGPILGYMASQGWIDVDSQAVSIMTVLLFGAGTDYCLFLISRYRHLLTEEESKAAALRKAVSDAGGAIAMSGLTVVIALLTLLLARFGGVHRFAVPFSLSILVMALASLTLVPALLAILGRGSFWPFVPRTPAMAAERAARRGKPAPSPRSSRRSGLTGRLVVRHPWKVAGISLLLLGSLAAVSSQVKFTYDILSSFPSDMESREGFRLIGEQFSEGKLAPVTIIADTQGRGGMDGFANELKSQPYVASVSQPQQGAVDPDIRAWTVELSLNPYSLEAMDRIPEMRRLAESALAGTGAADPAGHVWIAGQTAVQYDTRATQASDTRLIIPVVIGLIALLLLVYLRSATAMLYLIGTVILSYFSALGLGWLVLQAIGIDAIQGAIPLYAFVFLVALGEDYNIFMVSGIWKKRRHMPLRQAISEGVNESGPVITSAGLILAGTFAVLATLPIQVLLQFGLITALGVLLDTFIVRPFLVPALTALLGRWAFWPAGLHRTAAEQVPDAGTAEAGRQG